jgi:hypothetical protein
MDVPVLVVVKHMIPAMMFWRTCMKWHYSPEREQSQEEVSSSRR